ncbi:MAG: ABC transporter substrate-binding protein [Treponema sp.]
MKKIVTAFFIFLTFTLNFYADKNPEKTVSRIVSLGPSATEILFAINAEKQIVARTDLCDYPAESKNIRSVGGFSGSTISLEAILSVEPDLVYLFAGMHDYLIQPLKNLGIKVFVSNANSIQAVKDEILEIGKITGHQDEAQKVVLQMELKIKSVRDYVAQKKAETKKESPSVYWEIWNSPLMSVGKNSFINDIIKYAGGKNIFESEESSYPVVSEEAVILANPDYVFFTGDGTKAGSVWKQRKGWNVPREKIFYAGDDVTFVRPGPRCVLAIEKLAHILWEN